MSLINAPLKPYCFTQRFNSSDAVLGSCMDNVLLRTVSWKDLRKFSNIFFFFNQRTQKHRDGAGMA